MLWAHHIPISSLLTLANAGVGGRLRAAPKAARPAVPRANGDVWSAGISLRRLVLGRQERPREMKGKRVWVGPRGGSAKHQGDTEAGRDLEGGENGRGAGGQVKSDHQI